MLPPSRYAALVSLLPTSFTSFSDAVAIRLAVPAEIEISTFDYAMLMVFLILTNKCPINTVNAFTGSFHTKSPRKKDFPSSNHRF